MEVLERLLAPQTEQARERRVNGVVTAKVKAIEDGGYYRLDYLSMGNGEPSAPARVMMPMAGQQRGTYFFPEVGDEVVVGFELGDTSLPVILGAVWNRESPPPAQARQSTDNDVRTIVSRSGHEVTFDDTPAGEKVTIKTKGGHIIELDDAPGRRKITVQTSQGRALILDDTPPGQITLSTPAGNGISLSDAGGQMTISAPLKLEIKSQIIDIQGTVINLLTTGQVSSSAVIVDNKPFGLHLHDLGGGVPTGPVMP